MTWVFAALVLIPAASAVADVKVCAGTCVSADVDGGAEIQIDDRTLIKSDLDTVISDPGLLGDDRAAEATPAEREKPQGFAAARDSMKEAGEEIMSEPAGRAGAATLFALLTTTLGWSTRAVWRAGFWTAKVAGAIVLFSRIKKDDLVDHPVRAKVLDVLEADPGIPLQSLQSRLDVAWGTAVYHVNRMEKEGLIVSQHEGNRRLFFVAGTHEARMRADLALVQTGTSRRIAQTVLSRPGIDQKSLCGVLEISNPTASKHLSRLEKRGLVESRKVSRRRLYRPTASLAKAMQIQATPEPVLAPRVAPMVVATTM